MENSIPARRPTRDALCLGIEAYIQLLSLHTRPRDRFHVPLVFKRGRGRSYRGITGAGQEQPEPDVEIEIENNSCSSTSHPLGVEDEANIIGGPENRITMEFSPKIPSRTQTRLYPIPNFLYSCTWKIYDFEMLNDNVDSFEKG
jgi:hypothetical protein